MSRVLHDVPVDSKDGIELLMHWAKRGGAVLNSYHKQIAQKYGVSTDGIRFAEMLP